jgi:8-oxo-dGTP diphosphatase
MQGVESADYTVVPRTLSFISAHSRVLLLRGGADKRLFAGHYNGVGGHVRPGEDVYAAARREIFEETSLRPVDLALCGVVHLSHANGARGVVIFVFLGTAAEGRLRGSSEGQPEWVAVTDLKRRNLAPYVTELLEAALESRRRGPFIALARDNEAHGRIEVTWPGRAVGSAGVLARGARG